MTCHFLILKCRISVNLQIYWHPTYCDAISICGEGNSLYGAIINLFHQTKKNATENGNVLICLKLLRHILGLSEDSQHPGWLTTLKVPTDSKELSKKGHVKRTCGGNATWQVPSPRYVCSIFHYCSPWRGGGGYKNYPIMGNTIHDLIWDIISQKMVIF